MSTHIVNVARFARNVEWDFFCDFQTPWFRFRIIEFSYIQKNFLHVVLSKWIMIHYVIQYWQNTIYAKIVPCCPNPGFQLKTKLCFPQGVTFVLCLVFCLAWLFHYQRSNITDWLSSGGWLSKYSWATMNTKTWPLE